MNIDTYCQEFKITINLDYNDLEKYNIKWKL